MSQGITALQKQTPINSSQLIPDPSLTCHLISHPGASLVVSPTPPCLLTIPQLCIFFFLSLEHSSLIFYLETFHSSLKVLLNRSGHSESSNCTGIHRFICIEGTTVSASNEHFQTQRGLRKSTGLTETASTIKELTI